MYKSFADQPLRTRRVGITNNPGGLSQAPDAACSHVALGEDGCRAGGRARVVPATNMLGERSEAYN